MLLQRLLNRLRLKHFALLRALGDSRNLHLAAEELNMTQPSATKLLKDVETLMGMPLFVRHSRGLAPTALGDEVVAYSQALIGQMGHFTADLDAKRHGGHGTLSVGAIMGATPDVVAPAVAQMKARYPRLTLRLLGDTSDHIMQLMDAHQLELAICRFSAPEQQAHFTFEPLGNEQLLFVVAATHPLARQTRPPQKLRELMDQPWVVQPLPSPSRVLLEREFAVHDLLRPTNLIECSSIFAALQIVQHSQAVTMLAEPVVRDALRLGQVVALPVPHRVALQPYGLLTRRGSRLSNLAQEFCAVVRDTAAQSTAALAPTRRRATQRAAAREPVKPK